VLVPSFNISFSYVELEHCFVALRRWFMQLQLSGASSGLNVTFPFVLYELKLEFRNLD